MKKLKLWDYHVHTKLCNHARGNVEDYVKQAIKINLGEIGISGHFPMILLPEESHDYAMGINEFPEYLAECKRAKNKCVNYGAPTLFCAWQAIPGFEYCGFCKCECCASGRQDAHARLRQCARSLDRRSMDELRSRSLLGY